MADLRRSSKGRRGVVEEEAAREPNLPPSKAFLVQFSRETGQAVGTHSGRVEHLGSGQRLRFESTRELLDFFEVMLRKPPAE